MSYEATVRWRRGADEPFTDNRYSRAHEWEFDGGARRAGHHPRRMWCGHRSPIPRRRSGRGVCGRRWPAATCCSSSPSPRAKGFTVASYTDAAIGTLSKGAEQREWMSRVTLRPHVVFEGDKRPAAADVDALHHAAHEACYIANSVKSEVAVEARSDGLA